MKRRPLMLAAGLTTVLVVTYLPVYNPDDAAAVMQRGTEGDWVREESTHLSIGFRALHRTSSHAGAKSLSNTERAEETPPMHISRIWIINQSEGFFAREYGRAIQEALLADPLLDEVAYFPASDLPLLIRRPPHLFVTYRLEAFEEHHWPVWFDWEVSIRTQIGASPLAMPLAPSFHEDSRGSAIISEYGEAGIGLVTQAVRFEQGLGELVSKLGLKAKLAEWRGSGASDIPLAWAGEIPTPPTDLGWMESQGAQLLVAQAPAPLSEEHVWAFPKTLRGPGVLPEWKRILQQAGWQTEMHLKEGTEVASEVLAHQGTRSLHLYSLDAENPEFGPFAASHRLHATPERLAVWLREHVASAETLLVVRQLVEALPNSTKRALALHLERQGYGDFPAELRAALR